MAKMVDGFAQWFQVGFVLLDLANVSQILRTHLCSGVLLRIDQNLRCLMDQFIRPLERRP
jgi:hypothetical protein